MLSIAHFFVGNSEVFRNVSKKMLIIYKLVLSIAYSSIYIIDHNIVNILL